MCGNLNFIFATGGEDTGGCPLALFKCESRVEGATFSNCWREIMWKYGTSVTLWLSSSSTGNLPDLRWENSSFLPVQGPPRETDVEMSNLYSCISENAQEEDGEVNDIRGEEERGPVWQLISVLPFSGHTLHCCFLVGGSQVVATTLTELWWCRPLCYTVAPCVFWNVGIWS